MQLSSQFWVWVVFVGYSQSTSLLEAAPGAPATVDPTPTLEVSSDGTCGKGITCLGSRYGSCCSAKFWCGNSDDYCGTGCHRDFGRCNESDASMPSAADTGCTTTSTLLITETSIKVSTRVITSVAISTSVVQSTSIYSAYVISSSVISSTSVATVTATEIKSLTETDTTVITSTHNVVASSTSMVRVTSTVYVTAAAPPAPVPSPDRTSSAVAPNKTFSGTTSECKKWYQIRNDDTCQYVATVSGLSLQRLLGLNPLLVANPPPSMTICDNLRMLQQGGCRVDCVSMFTGYYLCIGT